MRNSCFICPLKLQLWNLKDIYKALYSKVFSVSHFGSFYPQNLVLDPQKLGARVPDDAYMINPKLYSFMEKARIINILVEVLTSLKKKKPES